MVSGKKIRNKSLAIAAILNVILQNLLLEFCKEIKSVFISILVNCVIYFTLVFLLQFLKDKGYKQTSLSVQKANYAANMYRKLGFEVVIENEEEYIMLCKL